MFEGVLQVGFFQDAEKDIGDVEAGIHLLAGAVRVVEHLEQPRVLDEDHAQAIQTCLEGRAGGGLEGRVRLADQGLRGPGVVPRQGHQDQGGHRLHAARV
ncbi:MAG TPA: hypothetical protein VGE94_08075 [Chloroflexota bacterium]